MAYLEPRQIPRIYMYITQLNFMTTKIQRWGNSQGVRIPKDLLREAGIGVGEEVNVSVENGILTITPVSRTRGKYKLENLLREMPTDYEPGEVEWGDPTGKEVW